MLGHFVFEYLEKNRIKFNKLKVKTVLTQIANDNSYISKFESYLKEGGVDIKLATDKDIVMKYIIAEFSRQLISEKEYFVTILKNDPMLNAALK